MLSRAILRRSTQALRAPVTRRTYSSAQGGFEGATENAFNRERAAVKQHAAESSELVKPPTYLIFFSVVLPALAISAANAYRLWSEHWEHESHMPPLEERPEYPYQNIRTKNFFWGDGDKTLFWNDKVNHHKQDE
ncbi:hypothetical protein SLS58_006765 [Diplodia intermedia]|uniref:Cytochrome c oxidase subunit n=1 Tax=Diplodia intermedia TaxID=856260 RepID=A0ABR3TM34_9PEZI